MRLRLLPPGVLLVLALGGCSDLGDPLRRAPQCDVSATSVDFGTVAVNDSASRTLVIRNLGNAHLAGSVALACPPFRVVTGGGPYSLAPGETLAVGLRFLPTAPGDYSCLLELASGCSAVSLAGTGLVQGPGAVCEVVPNVLDFGATTVGSAADRTFTIRSVGSADVHADVVSPCAEFMVVTGGGPAVIPPGDSLVVTVRFDPTSGGSFNCAIAVGPSCPDVNVTGSGVAATTVSYAADIQPIFNLYCTGCHAGSGGLFLEPGVSYGNLVNVTSQGYAPALRVKPFDLAGSVLYGKLSDSGQYGTGMPVGGTIGQSNLDKVKTWILEGAKNN
jgi:hypothetical protein